MNTLKCITATCLAVTTCIAFYSCSHNAAPPPQDKGPYFPEVKQVIANNCLTCHSPGGQGMPVNLTIDDNIIALAETIKAAVIDPASPRNKRMPLGGELSDADKAIIQKWYDKGGKSTD
jgi:uncharacterized membrane protein